MGTSLNGLTPAGTYPGLIKTGDNAPIDGTLKTLSDGNGNNLPMAVSTTAVNFTGTLTQAGTTLQPTLVSGTNIKTINGASLLGSGDIPVVTSPSGIAGAIQFSNGSAFASDAANLFWDDTNNRLGVGTNTPSQPLQVNGNIQGVNLIATNNVACGNVLYGNNFFCESNGNTNIGGGQAPASARLQVKGSGSTSATTSLLVQNSASTQLFKVQDDGLIIASNRIFGRQSDTAFSFGTSGSQYGVLGQISGNLWALGSAVGPDTIQNPLITWNLSHVGIGTNSPTAKTHIVGTGSTSATTALLVQNSTGLSLMTIPDGAGRITFGIDIEAGTFFGQVYIVGKLFLGSSGSAVFGNDSLDASAVLQANSTTKGFLPPRMTTTQKNAIASPASGLVVYDSTTNKLCCYNGSTWNDLF